MEEYFAVLRVSRDDLINISDKKDKKLIEKIKNLSDERMGEIAGIICDYIYDGDSWDDACRSVKI